MGYQSLSDFVERVLGASQADPGLGQRVQALIGELAQLHQQLGDAQVALQKPRQWKDGEVVGNVAGFEVHDDLKQGRRSPFFLEPGGRGVLSRRRTGILDGRTLRDLVSEWVMNGITPTTWKMPDEQDAGPIGIVERRGADLHLDGAERPFFSGVQVDKDVCSRRGPGDSGGWKIGVDGVYVLRNRTLKRVEPRSGKVKDVYTFQSRAPRDRDWMPAPQGFVVYDGGHFLLNGSDSIQGQTFGQILEWYPVPEGVMVQLPLAPGYPSRGAAWYLNRSLYDSKSFSFELAKPLADGPVSMDRTSLWRDELQFAPKGDHRLFHPQGVFVITGDEIKFYNYPSESDRLQLEEEID
ncbi:MAG: hypothetical protein WC777_02675 [Candidatus Gracilibacteria bacterium]|jgi:hypothetical protein